MFLKCEIKHDIIVLFCSLFSDSSLIHKALKLLLFGHLCQKPIIFPPAIMTVMDTDDEIIVLDS